jgi:hypothetical protein
VATCPGSLIVHADGTVAVCSEDDERDGCRGRNERHDGGKVRCIKWFADARDYGSEGWGFESLRARSQKPSDCLTKIALTRLGVIARLMMRMLFTPLGTP